MKNKNPKRHPRRAESRANEAPFLISRHNVRMQFNRGCFNINVFNAVLQFHIMLFCNVYVSYVLLCFQVLVDWLTTYKYYKHARGQHHYNRISAFEITYCTALPRAVWAMHSEVTAYLRSLSSGEAKSSNRSTQRSWPSFSTSVSKDPLHWWTQQAFFLQEHWFQMVLDNK